MTNYTCPLTADQRKELINFILDCRDTLNSITNNTFSTACDAQVKAIIIGFADETLIESSQNWAKVHDDYLLRIRSF